MELSRKHTYLEMGNNCDCWSFAQMTTHSAMQILSMGMTSASFSDTQ